MTTDFDSPEHPRTSPLSAGLPHRPADDSEEAYFEGSPLLRGAVAKGLLWILVGLVLIAGPVVVHYAFQKPVPLLGFVIPIVLGLIVLSVPIIKAATIRYRITNYRIDYERGILRKDIDTLELWHVEDIQFHQTILDRILGIGSITILSHDDTTPKLILHSLPRCRQLFDQLKQRIIAVKRQRGVIKMDTGT
jgi:membrane protein YdbS with pleckstrin-like domain